MPLTRNWGSAAFIILAVAAFLTRLLPLSISQYPFNNDGLTECRIASDLLQTGSLDIHTNGLEGSTHSIAVPAMNLLLAYSASILGVDTLTSSQVFISVFSVLTVSGVYVLGEMFSGDSAGGISAGLMAVLFGTFVFTTGSVWKESLGMSLFVLLLVSFVRRDEPRFRYLCLLVLMILPLIHHLVTIVALLTLAFPLVWSWYVALTMSSLKPRNVQDVILIAAPSIWTIAYYSFVSFDRLQTLGSTWVLLMTFSFVILCLASIAVLSMKNHSKYTYAPIPGIAVVLLLTLDYYGFLFTYTPSAPVVFLLLVAVFGVMISIAWYGTEVALSAESRYRAVQLGLLLAPLTLVGFGVFDGFSPAYHQVVYRSFDFADIFVFLGVAIAIGALRFARKPARVAVSMIVVASLVISFPFGYYTDALLGVRHDTQAYEADGVTWLADEQERLQLISDERVSYIAFAMADIPKDSTLPQFMILNYTLPPYWFCAVEDSITTAGVNDFPRGRAVVPESNYTWAIESSDAFYIGGPRDDRLTIFATSNIGHTNVFGQIPF
jgi:hypothetical protein